MRNYIVVVADSITNLEKRVDNETKLYEPIGGIAISYDTFVGKEYHQAMVLRKNIARSS